MEKFLKWIWVLQEVSNKDRKPKLGRGYSTAQRFNPYNPLTYIVLVAIVLTGMFLQGFVGFWKDNTIINPFKWD